VIPKTNGIIILLYYECPTVSGLSSVVYFIIILLQVAVMIGFDP
jgi:hypothetical protein